MHIFIEYLYFNNFNSKLWQLHFNIFLIKTPCNNLINFIYHKCIKTVRIESHYTHVEYFYLRDNIQRLFNNDYFHK